MGTNGDMTFIQEENYVSVAGIWCGTEIHKVRAESRLTSEREGLA